jgi:hypothetical protein
MLQCLELPGADCSRPWEYTQRTVCTSKLFVLKKKQLKKKTKKKPDLSTLYLWKLVLRGSRVIQKTHMFLDFIFF